MKNPILLLTTTDGELLISVEDIEEVIGQPEESTCMLYTRTDSQYEVSGTVKEIFEKIKQAIHYQSPKNI